MSAADRCRFPVGGASRLRALLVALGVPFLDDGHVWEAPEWSVDLWYGLDPPWDRAALEHASRDPQFRDACVAVLRLDEVGKRSETYVLSKALERFVRECLAHEHSVGGAP